jgi:hypothetical protein
MKDACQRDPIACLPSLPCTQHLPAPYLHGHPEMAAVLRLPRTHHLHLHIEAVAVGHVQRAHLEVNKEAAVALVLHSSSSSSTHVMTECLQGLRAGPAAAAAGESTSQQPVWLRARLLEERIRGDIAEGL